MSLTRPGPVAHQHNHDKSSAPLRQNQYHSKSHTPPDKRGASAEGSPPPDNQQSPQVSQYNNNGKNTPSLDFSDLSITVAVLWQLLIKNTVYFIAKKLALLTGKAGRKSQYDGNSQSNHLK